MRLPHGVAWAKGTRPAGGTTGKASVRRQVAAATWRPSKDGRIYARVALDATPILAYVDRARSTTGEHVTVTHVVGAAVGRAIWAVPEVRARVVFGRIREFETCDVSFAVDIGAGADLAPVKVRNADQKTPAEIARELTRGGDRLRAGRAAVTPRARQSSRACPGGRTGPGSPPLVYWSADWASAPSANQGSR